MCSIISVCSKRFSTMMMSMTSCCIMLVSYGASSLDVMFHPLGVLSDGVTLPISALCAHDQPETDTLCLLCHGFNSHQKCSHHCLSRFNSHGFALCIIEYMQTSTFIPYNRLANCRVRHSNFVPLTLVSSCCWMPFRHHSPARCRVDSKREGVYTSCLI